MKEELNENFFSDSVTNTRGVDINSDAVICLGIQKHAQRFRTRNIPLELSIDLNAISNMDAPKGGFSVFAPITNKTILSKCLDSGLYKNIGVAMFCYAVYKENVVCWIQALTNNMEMVIILQNSNEHFLIDLPAASKNRIENARILFQSTERYKLAFMSNGRNTGNGNEADIVGSLVYNLYEGSPSNQGANPVTPSEQHIKKEDLLFACISKELHDLGKGGSIMLAIFATMCGGAMVVSGGGALPACALMANTSVMGILFGAWVSCDAKLRNEYGEQWDNGKEYLIIN